jgi:flagellin
MTAQFNLQRANTDLETRLQRLATGLRINRGADDPAGLIVSERLRTELEGIKQGVKNSERASNVIATTEGSLSEVNEMLNTIKALVVEAANTGAFSDEEVKANQLQIDSAIDSITRIANTASFGGLKLLNGSLGYNLSSVDDANIAKAKVNSALFADRSVVDVDVEVVGSAQQGEVYFNTDYADFPTLSGGAGGAPDSLPRQMTVEVAGPEGVVELTLASGSTNQQIIQAINDRTGITGVEARAVSGADVTSGIVFNSVDYGEDAFVSVDVLSGGHPDYTFAKILNDAPGPIDWGNAAQWTEADRDQGKDVVVLLNGAIAKGDGLKVTQRGPELDVELLLTEGFATNITGTPSSFEITGGGALFQLGPEVTANQQVSIGVDSIAATRLGGSYLTNDSGNLELMFLSSLKSGGANDLRGNLQRASTILENAIDDVSTQRGRLGAFERNVVDANIRSLQSGIENLTAAESVIRDADFAAETSKLTRAQVLSQSGTQVLGIANQQAQQVLSLLG